ncbi:hypothetical protein H4R20_007386, partial [Coemansia guatemalensis]
MTENFDNNIDQELDEALEAIGAFDNIETLLVNADNNAAAPTLRLEPNEDGTYG